MKSIKAVVFALLGTLAICHSALGDDIEIYYGISDKAQTVNPNVIFIFDTSGSMSAVDGTSSSRMYKSKEALIRAINTISGVNVSLMRFSNYGGPVLIPAVDIDAEWEEKEIVRSLYGDYDFAVSDKDGKLDTQFSREYLVDKDHNRTHIMRFTGFDIPKGATIESAHITYFSEADSSTDDVTFTYFGLVNDAPSEFTDGESLAARLTLADSTSAKTGEDCDDAAAVCWKPSDWLAEDYPMNTPNLAAVVQALVDHADWVSEDPLMIAAQVDKTGY
jgi:type IV pilus assembly protein PilY1